MIFDAWSAVSGVTIAGKPPHANTTNRGPHQGHGGLGSQGQASWSRGSVRCQVRGGGDVLGLEDGGRDGAAAAAHSYCRRYGGFNALDRKLNRF